MQAKETRLTDIIEGTKQYVVPLFQRSYSWTKKEWDILWNDIADLYEMESPRIHFFGSIVNMPANSVPEGVSKFLLIDGQQRLTISAVVDWKKEDIKGRAMTLVEKALEIWPYFGNAEIVAEAEAKTFSTPQSVYCLGRYSAVKSWRDVLSFTLDTIYEELPEQFNQIVNSFPKWFGKDASKFRAARLLKSGYCIEVNENANNIYAKCVKILGVVHLVDEDWKVVYEK